MYGAELQSMRDDLRARGFGFVHKSRADILVRPELYKCTLDALERDGIHLILRHVVVQPSLEHIVINILSSIPYRKGARVKDRRSVWLGFVHAR